MRVRRMVQCAAWLIALFATSAAANDYVLTLLDDFEDVTAWTKGDPNTDVVQKDAAVGPSHTIVREGKQSLAFMVRINWTPKPGEKYPKGWPMISRIFPEPQDWSAYDQLQFWLYTETECQLPRDRVLRCGFSHSGAKVEHWHTLPGIRPNAWQLMSVPLDPHRNWSDVTGIYFYIAEAWYRDGDRVNFYLDDMHLAARKRPVLLELSTTSRTLARGPGVHITGSIEGQPAGAALYCTISDLQGRIQHSGREVLSAKTFEFLLPMEELPAGGHYLTVQLADRAGHVNDVRRLFFRSLEPDRKPYLSLVTFYTPWLLRAEPRMLALLNDSAYDGVAIPLWGAYYTGSIPGFEDLRPKVKEIGDTLDIDPWPWVFLNRFIGSPEDARGHASAHADNLDYFRRIDILDLDNETGARADMLDIWRLAVRAARDWGAPGIVLDLEAYNNYRAYSVSYVAERRGEPVADVIAKCEAVGAELARICEQEYPQCVVWSLFSHLSRQQRLPGYPGPVYSTAGHITLGFLKYAKQHNLPCRYLCGGETSVGYYNANVEALEKRIAQRDRNMAHSLARFPDNLFLAGTISPYHDYTILTSWIKDRAGENPELKTIADFQPMFKTLFEAYDWVWIYASSAAKTLPYDRQHSQMYSAVLQAALDEVE